ncbi:terminase TerL endonuclease subunit [Limnoglobus roseus]|uniref:Terminase large subunit n=1 Tax=Limnoglobus roseus TaxID=2598579 RepID=A0A5C1AF05_9BACT|nr:terminase TerL endonuclease subunit [Limnoglobus roseus]QEL16546.1 terminase large subunit [Limnoglobus roseus]
MTEEKQQPPAWAIKTKSDEQALLEGCYWDQEAADKIIWFIEKHFRSQHIPGKIKLRPTQIQLLQEIEGWRLPDGRRRWRVVNLHCPKKGFGKTLMTAIYAFYSMLASGEPSPTVFTAAANRTNAAQIYKEVKYAFDKANLTDFTRQREHIKEIEIPSTNGHFKSLTADAKSNHGWNVSVLIVDEAHVVPEPLWHALRYATDARNNGLVFVISTAGAEKIGWYYDLYCKSKRVISGEEIDITYLPLVYEADADAKDYDDPAQWRKANPYLGSKEFPEDQFRRDYYSAKAGGIGEYYNFLNLKMNLWISAASGQWFDVSNFDSFKQPMTPEELVNFRCMGGLDLGMTTDPTAWAKMWDLGEGKYYIESKAWVPAESMKYRKSKKLPLFTNYSDIELTDGDMVDADLVKGHILADCKKFNIEGIYADTTSSFVLGNQIMEEGYNFTRVSPSFQTYNPAMLEFKRAYDQGRITHNGSTWLRFCLSNVRIQVSNTNEIRPTKRSKMDLIDGFCAAILRCSVTSKGIKTVSMPS